MNSKIRKAIAATMLLLGLQFAGSTPASALPNFTPDMSFPGASALLVILKIILGILVVALIALFALGLVKIVAALRGGRDSGMGAGIGMTIGSAVVLAIMFSFTPW
jgi:hypothetical protein